MRVLNHFWFFVAATFLVFLFVEASQQHSSNKEQDQDRNHQQHNSRHQSSNQRYNSENGHDEWQKGKKYTYFVDARTLSKMSDSTNGVVIQAELVMLPSQKSSSSKLGYSGNSDSKKHGNTNSNDGNSDQDILVSAYVKDAKIGTHKNEDSNNFDIQVNGPLPQTIEWKAYPYLEGRFDFVMRGGLVQSLYIPQDMKHAEANLLRGLLSALQYDTSKRNLKGRNGFLDEQEAQGVFNKMEKDVTGKCQTLYTVSPFPRDELQRYPSMAPLLSASETHNGQLLQITKTKDHGNCDARVAYHFGVPKGAYWEDTTRSQNNFMSRTTLTKLIVDRQNNTIYSTSYKSVVTVDPVFNNNMDAQVISAINMTLTEVQSSHGEQVQSIDNLHKTNLRFRIPTERIDDQDTDSYNSNESSSSSSSSEEDDLRYNHKYPSGSKGNSFNYGQGNQQRNRYNKYNSYSSFSSSHEDSNESSDRWLDSPDMSKQIRTGRSGSQSEHKKSSRSIEEMSNSIAEDLQQSYHLPKKDILERWNNIVQRVQTIDSEHLSKLSQKMFNNKDNEQRNLAWKLYRDAVAQSGTGPAYKEIKAWISSGKIRGEEAAQVIGSLAQSLRNPTKKLMYDFFDFAISHGVQEQQFLNTSALLAVTNFINKAHVDNSTVHRRYPVHLYGRMISSNDNIVTDKVLPYLEEQLNKAVNKDDSQKAHVYVKAIGNLGHPAIIKVFGPYLDGKKEATSFQRTLMVMSMSVYAMQYPHEARHVLYNILQNQGENYEVRVAAISPLMRSHPTPAMLQKMAIYSNTDPSHQVRSAVQSAIRSAAQLKQDYKQKLASYAKSAEVLLSDRKYATSYSKIQMMDGQQLSDNYNNYNDYDDSYDQGKYRYLYNQIGSHDSLLPKIYNYFFQNKNSAWMGYSELTAGVSSVGELMEKIQSYVHKKDQRSQNHDNDYDAQNIAENLKVKYYESEPLEGFLGVNFFNQDRFFSFDEQTVENVASHWMKDIFSGKHKQYNYTKVLNKESVTIIYPLAMGVPFIFEYNTPTMVRINGNYQANWKLSSSSSNPSPKVNINGEVDFHFATGIDGRVGFIDRLNREYRHFVSGVTKKLEVRIPLIVSGEINMFDENVNLQVESLAEDKEVEFIHMSSWPYTSVYEKDTEKTIAEHKSTTTIKDDKPDRTEYDVVGQQESGLAFVVQAYYDDKSRSSNNKDIWQMISQGNLISEATTLLDDDDNSQYIYSIKYSPSKSQTNRLKLYLDRDQEDESTNNNGQLNADQSNGKQWSSAKSAIEQIMSNQNPDDSNKEDVIQAMKKAMSGLTKSWALHVKANIDGKSDDKSAKYIMSVVQASNDVQNNQQGFVWFRSNNVEDKKFQLNVAYSKKSEKAPIFNFNKALDFDPTIHYDVSIRYGSNNNQNAKIDIQGKMEQTQERKEYVRNQPESKQCKQEMQEGNNIMPACENATIQANFMDRLRFVVSYENTGNKLKNMTYAMYKQVRQLTWQYTDEDYVSSHGKDNQVELDIQMSPRFRTLNASLTTPVGTLEFNNVPLNKWLRAISAVHPNYSPLQRLIETGHMDELKASCSVDYNAVNTFSNKTFSYTLDTCWHTLMLNGTSSNNRDLSNKQTSVLVRNTGSGKSKQVRIFYRNYQGDSVNVDMYKDSINVQYGNQDQQQNKQLNKDNNQQSMSLFNRKGDRKLLQIHTLQSGEQILNIDQNQLVVIFDGERVRLTASDSYRNNTRGVCGSMSDEPNDLISPKGCYYRNPKHFAASYVYKSDTCKDNSQKLYEEAQNAPCQFWNKHKSSLFNDYYNQQNNRFYNKNSRNSNKYGSYRYSSDEYNNQRGQNRRNQDDNDDSIMKYKSSKSYKQNGNKECSMQKQVQFYEQSGKICITHMPLPSCSQGCQSRGKMELPVKVTCKSDNDKKFQDYQRQIQNGRNPELSEQPNHQVIYQVPESCHQ